MSDNHARYFDGLQLQGRLLSHARYTDVCALLSLPLVSA
jgi:hypothetical protein